MCGAASGVCVSSGVRGVGGGWAGDSAKWWRLRVWSVSVPALPLVRFDLPCRGDQRLGSLKSTKKGQLRHGVLRTEVLVCAGQGVQQ
jgi:hypothetical protein